VRNSKEGNQTVDASRIPNPLDLIKTLPFVPANLHERLPVGAGIYFVVFEKTLLYIGACKSLRLRWNQHPLLAPYLCPAACKIYYDVRDTHREAFTNEARLIKIFRPAFNGRMSVVSDPENIERVPFALILIKKLQEKAISSRHRNLSVSKKAVVVHGAPRCATIRRRD
jgi:hypothetical protein